RGRRSATVMRRAIPPPLPCHDPVFRAPAAQFAQQMETRRTPEPRQSQIVCTLRELPAATTIAHTSRSEPAAPNTPAPPPPSARRTANPPAHPARLDRESDSAPAPTQPEVRVTHSPPRQWPTCRMSAGTLLVPVPSKPPPRTPKA